MPARNSRRLALTLKMPARNSRRLGYGVFAMSHFHPGELLMGYKGELASTSKQPAMEEANGFTFYFKHHDKHYSIDASKSDGFARMVNDQKASKTNCRMRKVVIDIAPRLLLYATKI